MFIYTQYCAAFLFLLVVLNEILISIDALSESQSFVEEMKEIILSEM